MFQSDSEIILTISIATIILLIFVGFLITFAQIFRQHQIRNVQEKIILQTKYEQEILRSQMEVKDATMQQIGRELHDHIGQLLSVARINLNILEDSEHSTEDQEYIHQTNDIIDQSIRDLRDLTKSLDRDFIKDFGLVDSLSHELHRIRRTKRYITEIEIVGDVYSLGFEKEIVLFRIAQEILNNAIKHSKASTIHVKLLFESTKLTLLITDNGIGFDTQDMTLEINKSGAGLRNMMRRAELINATLGLSSKKGFGTEIRVYIEFQNTS